MNMQASPKPIEILLVEDNPADVRLMEEVLRESKVVNNLTVAEDGIAAMAVLRREKGHAGFMNPDIILLDLNLPKKDGREVLAEIKEDPRLKRIPVTILTTSNAGEDISRSYALHANCYITKPFDLDDFINMIKAFDNFWLFHVRLPPQA